MFELCIVLTRVNDFLLAEERQIQDSKDPEQSKDVLISLENVSASWEEATVEEHEDSPTSSRDLSEKTSLLITKKWKG